MPLSNISHESKQFADRAVVESLIGLLDMDAKTGNPAIFQVQYRADDGELITSPYGLFAGQDADRLLISTGRLDEETLIIPKSAIVHITLVQPADIVRALNSCRPVLPLSRIWTATMNYYQESYRQWESAFTAARRVAGLPARPTKKAAQSRQEKTI